MNTPIFNDHEIVSTAMMFYKKHGILKPRFRFRTKDGVLRSITAIIQFNNLHNTDLKLVNVVLYTKMKRKNNIYGDNVSQWVPVAYCEWTEKRDHRKKSFVRKTKRIPHYEAIYSCHENPNKPLKLRYVH